MEVSINWKGRMIFEGSADSGHQVTMDTAKSLGGDNSAAQPMELIALGLAGCMGMDIISILQKKQQNVTDFRIEVHADRAGDYPKVFTNALIEFLARGRNLEEAALVRAIQLSSEKYCPAYAMLRQVFPIELRYRIYEGEEESPVFEGMYEPHPSAG